MGIEGFFPRTALPDEVLREAVSELDRGGRVVVATVIARHGSAPCTPGQKLVIVDAEGGPKGLGTVGGGAVEHATIQAMLEVLADPAAQPRMQTFRLGPTLGMCCGGSADVLIEPMQPLVRVLVVGAGHVGAYAAGLLATLGFRVVLCDAREEVADPCRLIRTPLAPEDLPTTPTVLCAEHDDPEVAEALGEHLDGAALLVATHDHQLDQQVIEWGLASGFGFVGGVGSRAKAAKTRTRLEAKGVAAQDVDRVRMPVGIAIHARTPAEIGVSIAAELTSWRAEHRRRRTDEAKSVAADDSAARRPSRRSRVGADS